MSKTNTGEINYLIGFIYLFKFFYNNKLGNIPSNFFKFALITLIFQDLNFLTNTSLKIVSDIKTRSVNKIVKEEKMICF